MLKKKTVRRVVVKVKAASRLTTRPILTFPVQFQNPGDFETGARSRRNPVGQCKNSVNQISDFIQPASSIRCF